MDNHPSHISVDALKLAKDHGVNILTLPPHTSHKTQPLDRTVLGPLKVYFNSAANSWMMMNPGRHITIREMGGFIGAAWMKAATPANITSGFRSAGIFGLLIETYFLMLILHPHCLLNSQHLNQTTLVYSMVKFPQIQVHNMVMELQSKEQRNSNAIKHL